MTQPRRAVWPVFCFLPLIALGACSQPIVSSTTINPGPETAPTTSGESVTAVYSLPMSVVTVTGAVDPTSTAASPKPLIYTVASTILPDNDARFRLAYRPTDLSDDSVTLTVDQNGLLSSVIANATGHQGDIVVAIATAAATAATLSGVAIPGAIPGGVMPAAVAAPKCVPSTPFTAVYKLKDLEGSDKPLPDCSTLHVEWDGEPAPPPPPPATAGAPAVPAGKPEHPTCSFSVCYRPLMTAAATISSPTLLKQATFVAVDPDSIEGLNLKSAPFVARTHTVSFTSGVETSAVISDPSVALAIANLPLTVVTAVLKAPQSILTIQSTNVQDQTAVLTAQTALINAQLALQKAVASQKTGSGGT